MKRYTQTFEGLSARLSAIETTWRDEFSARVEAIVEKFPERDVYDDNDLLPLLEEDFPAALTVLRLFAGLSKDEFEYALRAAGGGSPIGVTEYKRDPVAFIERFRNLGILEKASRLVARPVGWRDLLTERLRSGRGSAIKGQRRGRFLEDQVEGIVQIVFGTRYDARCQFKGAAGTSTEKADFAIPSKQAPHILIEVKAYGATGSKQTDVLGDFERIVRQKRDDTTLLLVTDGVSWMSRANDLRKLIAMQNQGKIARIYTLEMIDDLRTDLVTLKRDHGL